jgi:hypothetical protein
MCAVLVRARLLRVHLWADELMLCTRTITCRIVEVGDSNVLLWLLVEEEEWEEPRRLCLHSVDSSGCNF